MSDRGAVHLVVVALLFAGTLMLGLAVDITRVGIAYREASHLAAVSAEAGAGWIDEAAARQDLLLVDQVRARTAALAVASGPGRTVAVSTTPNRVCVRVAITVRPGPLALAGAGPREIAATGCAEPRSG